jgi:mono/diheme cytochrome c family protein
VDYFTNTSDARFRPGGVTVGPDGSLYVSDTEKGRIWRIIYTGETVPAPAVKTAAAIPAAPAPAIVGGNTQGGKIYAQVCASCHMANGSGVPGMQPALTGSAVIAGDPDRLIKVILHGPAAVLPADREKFNNVMPPFATIYKDPEIASLVNYLRKNFAPGSTMVTAAQVAALRIRP